MSRGLAQRLHRWLRLVSGRLAVDNGLGGHRMNLRYLFALPSLSLLVGCDALFTRTINVEVRGGNGAQERAAVEQRVGAVVDRVAGRLGLVCRAGATPAARMCSAQPWMLNSVATENGVVICLRQMGIPPERWKFDRQARLNRPGFPGGSQP